MFMTRTKNFGWVPDRRHMQNKFPNSLSVPEVNTNVKIMCVKFSSSQSQYVSFHFANYATFITQNSSLLIPAFLPHIPETSFLEEAGNVLNYAKVCTLILRQRNMSLAHYS